MSVPTSHRVTRSRASLLGLSAAQRLGAVVPLLLGLWLAVWWAL